jgi:flagellar hook-associated protein 1 FlgK
MSTLGNILSNASQALQAHQKATQVAGHNIANALTPGYSRQRAELATAYPLQTPYGTIGGGVRLADITRARDSLLDVTVRQENAAAEGHRLRHQLLGQIEASLLEFGDNGFATTLDAFWDAWGDLASYPGNDAARLMVQNRGEQVAGHLNRLAGGLEELRASGIQRLQDAVENLNRLAANVADLNRQIISAEAGGGTAADLRDSRDRALDELAKLTPVQVVERQNGGVGVMIGGITLVDDTVTRALSIDLAPGNTRVVRTDTGTLLDGTDGQIGALIQLLDTEIPGMRDQLDTLARGIVQSVNELHRAGTVQHIDPVTGTNLTWVDFFHIEKDALGNDDFDSVHAGNIRLADDVARDPSYIAIGVGRTGAPAGEEYQAGNTDIALAIGRLRDTPLGDPLPSGAANVLGNKTIGGYYQGIVTGLGARIATARASTTAHETLAQQAEIRRESVSGVSTDEEMVKLIQSQTAYQAAAKVITTVDEMLQTIINLV